ncbi:LysR family transcriptional regulator [Rhizobium lentis]|uniref:DNA-binding transcriptional LysR family regulator n=1 Tax=Rhizobium lentis TaxID=1138194 RepID=A0A7W8UJM2_9HYPH|nr:LysR family transcriptional regulator [Rhizobium lentis]MBB4572685.1 DNA-binding transcriptional LysR family regulator [Rhizobium lentis]MBB5548126.1 DNA-binding transcriptional LysR family regulator [Rhizobium lentis]MBB5558654.1 DNA-binding transcriptional LysR family regulator [Rhizobium lentis]MBB5565822.1 DNA-binding transcriptional LysR family regulator [Rhizobium lentis]
MQFDDLDLNLLRVFDIMMRERSVTRTAERLGRTQSAISHSLGRLRMLFRDDLFTRDGSVMCPTPRAVELLSEISGALSTIRSSIDRHQMFDPASTRRNFRVGLTDYHAMVFVPGLLREFARQAPHATLNIIPANGIEILNAIHLRQVDCALTGASIRDDPRVARIELGQDRLLCAVWSGSAIAMHGLTLDAYLAASHLQISADGVSSGLADIALKAAGLKRNIVATISNYLILPWVLRGTEFITHCGDGILHILDDASEVKVVAPPLKIENVSTSLLLQHHMATDPGMIWLTQVISQIYDGSQKTKVEIMKAQVL